MRGVAGDVHAEVSVEGDVTGQIAIGNNILQIRSLHGDLVMAASPGSIPTPVLRPSPVKVVPRRPTPFFGRRAETTLLITEANAGRAISVEGPSGIGRSTLLRHVATDDALQSVAYLPRRSSSVDDAAQVLFDHFYHCDVPIRPTAAQARHLLQQVRATVVADDVAAETARGLLDIAPNCGFVLTTNSPVTGVRSVTIGGLAADEARALFEYGLGRPLRPGEHDDADRVCMFGYRLIIPRPARADVRAEVVDHALQVARAQRGPISPDPITDALHAVSSYDSARRCPPSRAPSGTGPRSAGVADRRSCRRRRRIGLRTVPPRPVRCRMKAAAASFRTDW